MKNVVFILFLFLLACSDNERQSAGHAPAADSAIVTTTITDSIKLLQHLDSLNQPALPFHAEFYNRHFDTTIDLSAFKDRKLLNVPFRRIPAIVGEGDIDYSDDSTFNLTDTNYIARWNLLAKRPHFILVEVYDDYKYLATLTYNLHLIDAIRSGYANPGGNHRWNANRNTIIHPNLSLTLNHEYYQNVNPDENEWNKEAETENWYIDSVGHFRKR